jgi:hypothetical protein
MVVSLLVSLLGVAVLAVLYALAAWAIARRWGLRILPVAWLLMTLLAAAAFDYRIDQQRQALGMAADVPTDFPGIREVLLLWAAALGAVTWRLWRRLRRGETRFDARVAAGSVGAFFLGAFIVLLGYTIQDVRRMFGDP